MLGHHWYNNKRHNDAEYRKEHEKLMRKKRRKHRALMKKKLSPKAFRLYCRVYPNLV